MAGIKWRGLYLKITEDFMRLIHHKVFWFFQVPFGSMVKLQCLAQFVVGHLSYLAVSSLILLSH